jgi:hypothetical protein
MTEKPKKAPEVPDLPPVDPDAMDEAARKFLRKPKPPGGWKQGREVRQTETKEGDGT